MNEKVNKFLLTGDKFMPEMHLKQPGFTYSACGLVTKKKKKEFKNLKKQEIQAIFTKMNLIRLVFYMMAYGDFKDTARRTTSDNVLKDKAFNIAKNPKYDGYQRGLASMIYKFFDKKYALLPDKSVLGSGVNIEVKHNEQLAKELHKPIIRKLKKRKVYSGFRDNIWAADLADMQLISKFNKGFRFLLCVIDIFSKYSWVVPLKDKKGISIVNAFAKILNKSGCKPKKIWADKGSEFYNNFFRKWLKDNDIEVYSIHN